MVDCPFKNCSYRTNVYSSVNAHKSRTHSNTNVSDFKDTIILREDSSAPVDSELDSEMACCSQTNAEVHLFESYRPDSLHDNG